MKKDLIIGYASNYDKSILCFWINSIRKTEFKGDIVIIGTRLSKETIQYLESKGVKVFTHEQETAEAPPHVLRFFYLSLFLKENKNKYENVITTDTKDVIFQSNPSIWIKKNIKKKNIIASSECLKYEDEPWNNQNLLDAFGSFVYDDMKKFPIYNVGIIAGKTKNVSVLINLLFQLSLGRPISIVDQAVYNYLLKEVFYEETLYTSNRDKWAVNLAVCDAAIKIGSGHLGKVCKYNKDLYEKYTKNYMDEQPKFDVDGNVMNKYNIPFVIVHQWNRISGFNNIDSLKEKIEKKFGD